MKLSILIIAVIIFSCTFQNTSTAQSKRFTIITNSGTTISDCRITNIENDTVELRFRNEVLSIPVDSIHALIGAGRGETHFWAGALLGTVVGCTLGGLIGAANEREGSMLEGLWTVGGLSIGAASGFIVGGVIGAVAKTGSGNVKYILVGDTLEKVKVLKSLIGK